MSESLQTCWSISSRGFHFYSIIKINKYEQDQIYTRPMCGMLVTLVLLYSVGLKQMVQQAQLWGKGNHSPDGTSSEVTSWRGMDTERKMSAAIVEKSSMTNGLILNFQHPYSYDICGAPFSMVYSGIESKKMYHAHFRPQPPYVPVSMCVQILPSHSRLLCSSDFPLKCFWWHRKEKEYCDSSRAQLFKYRIILKS